MQRISSFIGFPLVLLLLGVVVAQFYFSLKTVAPQMQGQVSPPLSCGAGACGGGSRECYFSKLFSFNNGQQGSCELRSDGNCGCCLGDGGDLSYFGLDSSSCCMGYKGNSPTGGLCRPAMYCGDGAVQTTAQKQAFLDGAPQGMRVADSVYEFCDNGYDNGMAGQNCTSQCVLCPGGLDLLPIDPAHPEMGGTCQNDLCFTLKKYGYDSLQEGVDDCEKKCNGGVMPTGNSCCPFAPWILDDGAQCSCFEANATGLGVTGLQPVPRDQLDTFAQDCVANCGGNGRVYCDFTCDGQGDMCACKCNVQGTCNLNYNCEPGETALSCPLDCVFQSMCIGTQQCPASSSSSSPSTSSSSSSSTSSFPPSSPSSSSSVPPSSSSSASAVTSNTSSFSFLASFSSLSFSFSNSVSLSTPSSTSSASMSASTSSFSFSNSVSPSSVSISTSSLPASSFSFSLSNSVQSSFTFSFSFSQTSSSNTTSASSNSSQSLVAVLCNGTECTSFGDEFCGVQGLSCLTTPNEPCFICEGTVSSSSSQAYCGDGRVDPSEECDDGNTRDYDGCNSSCRRETCAADNDCPNGFCFRGVCFPTPPSSSAFSFSTSVQSSSAQSSILIPLCGNGILNLGEECDDGNNRPNDGCNAFCQIDGRGCRSDLECATGRCINGSCFPCITDDECSLGRCVDNVCQVPTFTAASAICGNGTVDFGEACDSGPLNSSLPNAPCRSDCSFPRCGDGILDSAELCDDGNNRPNDGCDQYCRTEITPTQIASLFTSQNITFPSQNSTQPLPFQLPLANLQPLIQSQGPIGDTGPAAITILTAGAASGIAWVRRRRK